MQRKNRIWSIKKEERGREKEENTMKLLFLMPPRYVFFINPSLEDRVRFLCSL
jgi:hypothetical protein